MSANYINHKGAPYGFRGDARHRVAVRMLVDSGSAAITANDAITLTGATAGYVQKVTASADRVIGFAMETVASPSADGDLSVLVDISTLSTYEFPPDTGTLTLAEFMDSCDMGADAVTINRDSSGVDGIHIISIDLTLNTALIKMLDVGIPGVA